MRLDTARLTPERAADIVLDQLPRAGVVDTTSYGRLPPSSDVGDSKLSVARVGAGDAVVAPAGCDRIGVPVSLAGKSELRSYHSRFRDDSTAGQGWHAPLRARCAEAAPAGTVRVRRRSRAVYDDGSHMRPGDFTRWLLQLDDPAETLTPEIARGAHGVD